MRDPIRRVTRVEGRACLRERCRLKGAVQVEKIAKSTLARVTNGAVNPAMNRIKRLVRSGAVGPVASNMALR
ncbi:MULTISPECIES: hypothetical protein [Paraburkholderia]|uniref:hypothetical protein n=1 Tax=Paraburkholderia TaxID=1822464 RepID=UPI00037EA019|nr:MULTISPECIES: hypothetical protein [Paraburkholderia]MDH6150963.1 hypothetical protein [Paraburkholderia sp. WSM4179]